MSLLINPYRFAVEDGGGGGEESPVWVSADQKQQLNGANSTSITIDAPSNVVSGDLLVCMIVSFNSGTNADIFGTLPSGWTQQIVEHNTGVSTRPGVTIVTKVAGGSEPSSYTFSGGFDTRHNALIGRVTGASGVDDSSGASDASGDMTIPAVTAVGASLLLGCWVIRWGGAEDVDVDVAMSTLLEVTSPYPECAFGEEDVADGSTGTRTGTQSVSGSMAGAMIVIGAS